MTAILTSASLRTKVTGIIILVSTFAIVVAITAFLYYQDQIQRAEIARDRARRRDHRACASFQ